MYASRSHPLPEDCSPRIEALFDYWKSICPPGRLPGRQHFDPIDIPKLLPNIWMLNVFHDPMRFRFRLVGTAIVNFTGRDSTGNWCHDVYEDFENTGAFQRMCRCAVEGVPLYWKSAVISNPGRPLVEGERLYLPLARDGKNVDILLIMTKYVNAVLIDGKPPHLPQGAGPYLQID